MTFQSYVCKLWSSQLFRFFTVGGICRFDTVYIIICALNVILLRLLLQINYDMYFKSAILFLPMDFVSFGLCKTLVFRKYFNCHQSL